MNVACTDPIEVFVAGFDGERAAFAHLHASNVRARRLEGSRNDRSHSVPCSDTPLHRMQGVLGSTSWLAPGPSQVQQ